MDIFIVSDKFWGHEYLIPYCLPLTTASVSESLDAALPDNYRTYMLPADKAFLLAERPDGKPIVFRRASDVTTGGGF